MEDNDNNKKSTQNTANVDFNELAKTMTKGIRRWEKVIYPMMIGFVILAIYGFYLIYNVTKDMHSITNNMMSMTRAVVTMTNTMNQKMNQIDHQMGAINIHMDKMTQHMAAIPKMTGNIKEMTQAIHGMNSSIGYMNQYVYSMVRSTSDMSSNLGELNDNISAPMKSMNNVVPWSMIPNMSNNRNKPAPRQNYQYPKTPYVQPMPMNTVPAARLPQESK